jgi:hypothetical protein
VMSNKASTNKQLALLVLRAQAGDREAVDRLLELHQDELVWVNLALWVWALAVRNRVGEQRILRAINTLIENTDEEVGQ